MFYPLQVACDSNGAYKIAINDFLTHTLSFRSFVGPAKLNESIRLNKRHLNAKHVNSVESACMCFTIHSKQIEHCCVDLSSHFKLK